MKTNILIKSTVTLLILMTHDTLYAMDSAPAIETSTVLATTSSVPPLTTLAMEALLAPVTIPHENTFKESLRETLKKEHKADIAKALHEQRNKLPLIDALDRLKTQISKLPEELSEKVAHALKANIPDLLYEQLSFARSTCNISNFTFCKTKPFLIALIEDKILIHNLETKQLVLTIDYNPLKIYSFTLSPDEQFLITWSEKHRKIWDLNTLTTTNFVPDTYYPYFSPDGHFLIAQSKEGTLFWDLKTRTQILTTPETTTSLAWPIFNPNGKFVAIPSGNEYTLWSLETFAKVNIPLTDKMPKFNPQDNLLLILADDRFTLWDLETAKAILSNQNTHGSVDFSPDGTFLKQQINKKLRVWNLKTMNEFSPIDDSSSTLWNALFSPGGQFLIMIFLDHATVWDTRTNQKLFDINEIDRVRDAKFSPNGEVLLTEGEDEFKIWSLQTHQELFPLMTNHTGDPEHASFSKNGQYLITKTKCQTKLWDIKLKQEVIVPVEFFSTMISPDEKFILTLSENQAIAWKWTDFSLEQCALINVLQNKLQTKEPLTQLSNQLTKLFNTLPLSYQKKLWNAIKGVHNS